MKNLNNFNGFGEQEPVEKAMQLQEKPFPVKHICIPWAPMIRTTGCAPIRRERCGFFIKKCLLATKG